MWWTTPSESSGGPLQRPALTLRSTSRSQVSEWRGRGSPHWQLWKGGVPHRQGWGPGRGRGGGRGFGGVWKRWVEPVPPCASPRAVLGLPRRAVVPAAEGPTGVCPGYHLRAQSGGQHKGRPTPTLTSHPVPGSPLGRVFRDRKRLGRSLLSFGAPGLTGREGGPPGGREAHCAPGPFEAWVGPRTEAAAEMTLEGRL